MGFIASLFGGGKQKESAPAPQPLPQTPTVDDAADEAEKKNKKKRATLADASRSVYSSPLGISGEANVARKSLLGQ